MTTVLPNSTALNDTTGTTGGVGTTTTVNPANPTFQTSYNSCTITIYNPTAVAPQACNAGYACVDSHDQNKNTTDAKFGICSPCRYGEFCPFNTSNLQYTLNANLCGNGNYCQFPNQSLTCPAGTICPSPTVTPINCSTPGVYCPSGQGSFNLCPAGFYCPTTNVSIQCPAGHYCKAGSQIPTPCPILGTCAAGSQFANVPVRAIMLPSFFLIGLFALYWLTKRWVYKEEQGFAHVLNERLQEYNLVNALLRNITGYTYDVFSFKGLLPKETRVTLGFQDLGLMLTDGSRVLQGVTGEFKNTTLNAVMGPSGSGKSTFLNVLTGKATYGKMEGKVYVNGYRTTIPDLRNQIGFVPQDDIVHTKLTVRENLLFSALLRLPVSMPGQQKLDIVDDALRMLGLSRIQDSIVGDAEKRGISGGQRKRVNIGLEIVAFPDILFLDEPTSGLDSTASLEVLSSLKDLSRLGVTVIAVIHQPRYTLFRLFDEVLLLGVGGKTVFQGKTANAMKYFSDNGFECPAHENPADFFLDVISGSVTQKGNPNFSLNDLFVLWNDSFSDRVHVFNDAKKELNLVESLLSRPNESNQGPSSELVEQAAVGPFGDPSNYQQIAESAKKTKPPPPPGIKLVKYTQGGDPIYSSLKNLNKGALKASRTFSIWREAIIPSRLTEHEARDRMYIVRDQEEKEQDDTIESHFLGVLPNHFEMLRIAFEQFDADQNGVLDTQELRAMFESFGQNLADKEIEALRRALGLEDSSEITLEVLQNKIELAKSKIDRRVARKTILTSDMRLKSRVTPSFWTAFELMIKRGLIQYLRDAQRILFDVVLLIVFAAFAALVFGASWRVADFPMICLLACLAIGLLGTNASIRVFGSERLIFWREASVGISIPAYFFSKILLDLFQTVAHPYIFIVTFFNIIVPELPFADMYVIFLAVYWYSSGLGILISLIIAPQSATLVGVLIPIIMGGFFSGLAPQLSSMGPVLQGLAKLSFSRWGIEALCAAEAKFISPIVVNQMYYQGYEQGFDVVFYSDARNIFIIGGVFRLLAFLAILLFNRSKRQ
eukprot:TRINITY_DN2380_c0_g2_i2.p1 TRINITY_DN2380_c0_g2~~TRINITY_DN2380_c0_g2_i2.p1  ORF type:complete len:1054 (+),score=272.70 TRINITY_DN2380_c0_g2_i2:35-3196(+)